MNDGADAVGAHSWTDRLPVLAHEGVGDLVLVAFERPLQFEDGLDPFYDAPST